MTIKKPEFDINKSKCYLEIHGDKTRDEINLIAHCIKALNSGVSLIEIPNALRLQPANQLIKQLENCLGACSENFIEPLIANMPLSLAQLSYSNMNDHIKKNIADAQAFLMQTDNHLTRSKP